MLKLTEFIAERRATGDLQGLVDYVPYARWLGMNIAQADGPRLTFRLRYHPRNIGNSRLPALHGGVIGAFMEHAALLQILWNMESAVLPRVVDFSIDYLRPGRPEDLFSQCDVLRQGLRVANAAVRVWHAQAPERTIATARCHFLLSRPEQGQL